MGGAEPFDYSLNVNPCIHDTDIYSVYCSLSKQISRGSDMKTALFAALLFGAAVEALAQPVTWQLVDFQFNDGGTAYGSFTYNSDTNQFSDIDIYTTRGSMLSGRRFVSTAGVWGSMPNGGTLAFSDTTGPDFAGAGWFRIDANIDFYASPGTVVNQWLNVGAESFCVNSLCSSAANEITNPGQSRDTISGYLVATAPIPEPEAYAMLLAGLGLIGLTAKHRRQKLNA